MEDVDNCPPLEDCSSWVKTKKTSKTVIAPDMLQMKNTRPENVKPIKKAKITNKKQNACGFSRGFLLNNNKKKTKKKKVAKPSQKREVLDVNNKNPLLLTRADVQPKKKNDTKENETKNLISDEVREAMRKHTGSLTDDANFIEEMLKDEDKMNIMMKPDFFKAISEFERDPKKALEKYKNNKEIIDTIRWFSGKMGNEMIKRGDQEEKQVQKNSFIANKINDIHKEKPVKKKIKKALIEEVGRKSNSKPAPATREISEKQKMKWLSDPEIRTALMNPEVQRIINNQTPGEWTKHMNHPGIQILLRRGVIQPIQN